MNTDRLKRTLIKHEGLRLTPYRCSAGKLTIGVGRNLEDRGISEMEARYLLGADVDRVTMELAGSVPYWEQLDDVRQEVLANMCFNLGFAGLRKFKKMWAAIERRDYKAAAAEMLDSKWASDVGERARYLSRAMEKGAFDDGR